MWFFWRPHIPKPYLLPLCFSLPKLQTHWNLPSSILQNSRVLSLLRTFTYAILSICNTLWSAPHPLGFSLKSQFFKDIPSLPVSQPTWLGFPLAVSTVFTAAVINYCLMDVFPTRPYSCIIARAKSLLFTDEAQCLSHSRSFKNSWQINEKQG